MVGLDGRWSLNPADDPSPYALLFTDDNGETESGYVAGIQFYDRALADFEVAALGSPQTGEISPFDLFVEETTLRIMRSGNQIILSWDGDDFLLEEADGLGSGTPWRESSLPIFSGQTGDGTVTNSVIIDRFSDSEVWNQPIRVFRLRDLPR